MKNNVVKMLLTLTIIGISFFSVKVKADMTCTYTFSFPGLGCGKTKTATLKFDGSGNPTFDGWTDDGSFLSECGASLVTGKDNKSHAKSYYSNNKTCPKAYAVSYGDTINLEVGDDNYSLPENSTEAKVTSSGGGGSSGNSGGSGNSGSSSSNNNDNNKVLCTYTRPMRNETWNVSIKFKKVNGVNKIEVGKSGQAATEAKATEQVGVAGYTFQLAQSLQDQIYNKGECPQIYLSLADNSNTTVTLTDVQPDASLDGSYNVNESPTQKYSDHVGNEEAEKTEQKVKDIGNVGDDFCTQSEVKQILKFFGLLILLLKFAVPIIIIVKGTFLFYNAVVKGEAADLTKSAKEFGVKIVIGLVIFFIPSLLNGIMGLYNGWSTVKSEYTDCSTCLLDPTNCNP